MRIIFVLFAIIIVCAAKVAAQSGDFFIPQQAIDVMNQTEQLPPLRIRQPQRQATENTDQTQTPSAKITSPEQPKQPSAQIADKKNSNPVAAKQTEKSPSLPSDTNQKKPLQAQKPMVPQTGTPAVPVYADNQDKSAEPLKNDNSPQPKTEKETTKPIDENRQTVEDVPPIPDNASAKIAKTETSQNKYSRLTYDDIIKEYHQDIQKISQNKPVDNERLQKMLEKYHDETITF